MTGVTSRFHSLSRKKANKRRKLVLWPDNVNHQPLSVAADRRIVPAGRCRSSRYCLVEQLHEQSIEQRIALFRDVSQASPLSTISCWSFFNCRFADRQHIAML
jgi:hypothetical protein